LPQDRCLSQLREQTVDHWQLLPPRQRCRCWMRHQQTVRTSDV